jgi:hypothetical protein
LVLALGGAVLVGVVVGAVARVRDGVVVVGAGAGARCVRTNVWTGTSGAEVPGEAGAVGATVPTADEVLRLVDGCLGARVTAGAEGVGDVMAVGDRKVGGVMAWGARKVGGVIVVGETVRLRGVGPVGVRTQRVSDTRAYATYATATTATAARTSQLAPT